MVKTLIKSMKEDHYVSDTGDILYYQTDPELYPSSHYKSNWSLESSTPRDETILQLFHSTITTEN